MTKIKICGLTNKQDVERAISLGATYLGFIFYRKSLRYVSVETVKKIIIGVPSHIKKVGVFVNETSDIINKIVVECFLDVVQLHGDERPSFCGGINSEVIKAIRVNSDLDLLQMNQYKNVVSAFLLDTKVSGLFGGTGQLFDWHLAIEAKKCGMPIFLSGGLTPQNVKKAIASVEPYAVDVSSGLESEPGQKDEDKMVAFFKAVL